MHVCRLTVIGSWPMPKPLCVLYSDGIWTRLLLALQSDLPCGNVSQNLKIVSESHIKYTFTSDKDSQDVPILVARQLFED